MARLVFVRQDIEIKVHFWPDSQLRPVTFNHQLKLYPNENAAAAQQVSKRPVVNEIYHELIFTAPEDLFVRPLPPARPLRPGCYAPAVTPRPFCRPAVRIAKELKEWLGCAGASAQDESAGPGEHLGAGEVS